MDNFFNSWKLNANINTNKQLPIFSIEDNGFLYPRSRQPLLIFAENNKSHHEMQNVIAQKNWISQQSFYFYLHEILGSETNIICTANSKIISNQYSVLFSQNIAKSATTIIIDEAFHSLAALDAITQLQEKTGIKQLNFAKCSLAETLLKDHYRLIRAEYQNDFLLIICCILENTITKDLDLFLHRDNDENISPFFLAVIEQHFRDEARHSVFANLLLRHFWDSLDHQEKQNLTPMIISFVNQYIEHNLTSDIEFTHLLLNHFQLNELKNEALHFCNNFSHGNMQTIKKSIANLFETLGIII